MVKHIVFYKFKNEEDMNAAAKTLMSMKGRLSMIRDIETGRDFLHSARSFMLALVVTLDSKAALDAYQADEYHVSTVKKFMHSVVTEAASVDYEI